jgi:SAM-dependent methyltransferase
MYQQEWFGLRLRLLTSVSPSRRPDAAFYDAFYDRFFQKYHNWPELGDEWLECKKAVARLICERTREIPVPKRLLSVGCGLGWVEHCLLEMDPSIDLEITEVSRRALRWIAPTIGSERVHVGAFPDCLPFDRRYELIYANAYDYCLDDKELLNFMVAARGRLTDHGILLIVSMSYQDTRDLLRRAARWAREVWVGIIEPFRIEAGWQLWGWYRGRAEYLATMALAGFAEREEGFVSGGAFMGQRAYYVLGRRS